MKKVPIYERNRRIQQACLELEKRNYAIHFRPRSRIFMINGTYYNENDGLVRISELLRKEGI